MPSEPDTTIYVLHNERGFLLVKVWVDDMLFAGTGWNIIEPIVQGVKDQWDVHDVGKPAQFSGLKITRDRARGLLTLSQPKYIKHVLQQTGFDNCNGAAVPMVPNTRLDDSGKYDPSTTANGASYRKVQGMFGWLQQCTRPDLSFAHRETDLCLEAPGHLAWAVQKHKLKYMSATRHVGITYRRSAGPGICIYSDSDVANRTTDRKSVEGYVMLCAGGAVSWGSRVRWHLADSSCMAEYMAACLATKHAMWTKNMLTALKLWPAHAGPIPLYVDNESAIKTALKEGTTTRNKHWEVQYHMVCQ